MKTLYQKNTCKIAFFLMLSLFVHLANGAKYQHNFTKVDTAKKTFNATAKKKGAGGTNEAARQKQEFLRLKDPVLNVVPTERLFNARKVRDAIISKPGAAKAFAAAASISNLNWHERGPDNVGGRTRALIFDLRDAAHGYKKVFAGAVDGGIWYTNDVTATPVQWHKISDFFDNLAISCIAQNPVNPLEIYAGTGEGRYNGDAVQGLGVWKSSDGGTTWAMLPGTAGFKWVNAIAVDKNGKVYIAGLGFGVQKSPDGGTTWNQVIATPADGADLEVAANGDIYAATGAFSTGNIFISDHKVNGANTGDAGTWTNITPETDGTITPSTQSWFRIELACAPSDANVTYAFLVNADGDQSSVTSVQKYDKASNTWALKAVPDGSSFSNGQGWYSIALGVDPNNANTIYAGSLDAEVSTDAGATWATITQWYVGEIPGLNDSQYVHADHQVYAFAPGSSTKMLMGSDGGIAFSSNINAAKPSFLIQNNTFNVTQFYSVALHPTNFNYALAGAQDNGTQQFTKPGIGSTTMVTGGDGADAFIDQLNGNIQIAAYTNDYYYVSTDNGANFNALDGSGYGAFINPTDYDSRQKNLYAGDYSGYYLLQKNITNPTRFDVPVSGFNSGIVTSVTVAPITANRVYFGMDNGTIVMVDDANAGISTSGVVLTPRASPASVSCIAVDPNSEDHILVSYFNYGVVSIFETKNASAATPVWKSVEGNLPDMPVRWVMFYPNNVNKAIIATELGVWTTDKINGGSTLWVPANSGLANVEVDMLSYRQADQTLAAATHGRGLFTSTLPIANNATLANLRISGGALSPAFAPADTSYADFVSNTTKSVKVTAITGDAAATVTVNGVAVTSGTASASIRLAVGANTITTVVTAKDGQTTKTYTVNITREMPPVTPTIQASHVTFSDVTEDAATISWTNGNGEARAVFIRQGANGSALPTDKTDYQQNNQFGAGSEIGNTGWFCIYNGRDSVAHVGALQTGTTYRVTVIEYSGYNFNGTTDANMEKYLTTHLSPANVTTIMRYPTVQARQLTFTNIAATTAHISWTNGNGTMRVVFVREGTTGSALPNNYNSYTANSEFGAGDQIGGTNWYCVYNGTGSDSDITGLTPGATYRVTVVDYLIIGFGERYIDPEITSASPNYVSSSLSPASFTTTTPYPTLEATKLKFSNITASSTTANWTSGNGSARAVFMHVGTSGSALPADNTTYSVNPKFGLGQQIGTTGWYCVYSGTGSSTNITDLSAGVTYRVTVVEYNGAPGHQKYDVTGLSPANVTTIQVYPTAPALQVKFTNTTNSGTTATWINGNGQKRAVFIRKGTDGAAIPLDNVTYTGNTIYQAGQQIGTTPWYCIYNGTASTTNIIGLLAGTAYRVTVVEYNGAPGSEKYMVTSLNPATVYTSGVAPLNGLFVNNNEVAPLTLTPGNQQIEANNVLSPNGDGVNDIWVVKNIAFYSNNTVTVYDKVGQVVYSKKNYANDWAGTYKGSTLNEGTYYYTINLGNGENVKGFLTVVKAK